ncbi:MAG: hypothetical protein ISS69_06930 [Phycisphaerae bacterium]|nr:hypothetical protein [Phycisphaerae bacterium]
MAGQILSKQESRPLVLADCEHFTVELVEEVYRKSMFDLIVPTPRQPYIKKLLQGIDPEDQWNAKHLAKEIFCDLDGGLRMQGDTVVVTYYNTPNAAMLREHFEGLSGRLASEGVSPEIPWLYNLKLDFRFK